MKKINILKNNRDFNRIIGTLKPNRYKDFVIYLEKDTNDKYHFGISVGKKIGNAVTRNKYKRRIKSIIDKNNYQNGFNCIIILKRCAQNVTFDELSKDLNIIIEKIRKEK